MTSKDKLVKRYEVDLYADKSDLEIMTHEKLLEFAEEQVREWYDEIKLNISDDKGAILEKYKEDYKLVDKIVNKGYRLQNVREVEQLFNLPAITIPFVEVYI